MNKFNIVFNNKFELIKNLKKNVNNNNQLFKKKYSMEKFEIKMKRHNTHNNNNNYEITKNKIGILDYKENTSKINDKNKIKKEAETYEEKRSIDNNKLDKDINNNLEHAEKNDSETINNFSDNYNASNYKESNFNNNDYSEQTIHNNNIDSSEKKESNVDNFEQKTTIKNNLNKNLNIEIKENNVDNKINNNCNSNNNNSEKKIIDSLSTDNHTCVGNKESNNILTKEQDNNGKESELNKNITEINDDQKDKIKKENNENIEIKKNINKKIENKFNFNFMNRISPQNIIKRRIFFPNQSNNKNKNDELFKNNIKIINKKDLYKGKKIDNNYGDINKYLVNKTDINLKLNNKSINNKSVNNKSDDSNYKFNKSPNLEIKKNSVIYNKIELNKENKKSIYYNKKKKGGFSKTKVKPSIKQNSSINKERNGKTNNNGGMVKSDKDVEIKNSKNKNVNKNKEVNTSEIKMKIVKSDISDIEDNEVKELKKKIDSNNITNFVKRINSNLNEDETNDRFTNNENDGNKNTHKSFDSIIIKNINNNNIQSIKEKNLKRNTLLDKDDSNLYGCIQYIEKKKADFEKTELKEDNNRININKQDKNMDSTINEEKKNKETIHDGMENEFTFENKKAYNNNILQNEKSNKVSEDDINNKIVNNINDKSNDNINNYINPNNNKIINIEKYMSNFSSNILKNKDIQNKKLNDKIIFDNIILKRSNSPKISNKIKLNNDIMDNLINNIKYKNILKNKSINNKRNSNDIKPKDNLINDENLNNAKTESNLFMINDSDDNGKNSNNIFNINTDNNLQNKEIKNEISNINNIKTIEAPNNNTKLNNISMDILDIKHPIPKSKINLEKSSYLNSYINKIDKNDRNSNNINQFKTDKEPTNKNIIILPPPSNKSITDRISKLNLNNFTTVQNRDSKDNKNNSKDKLLNNIKSSSDCLLQRNGTIEENQTKIFNGIENDMVNNGISQDNLISINDIDKVNLEEKNNNINYRRLKTDLLHSKNNNSTKRNMNNNANNDRCKLLRINKNLSSSNNGNKFAQKISYLSNTIDNNANNIVKRIKNQYPLFFNSHDYNENTENNNSRNKNKKNNKLLIKNLSNLKVSKQDKKKQKDILNPNNPKYLDASYFNKINNNLKLNNSNNCSTSVNDGQFFKGLKPPVPLSNIRKKTKEFNTFMNDMNTSYSNNNINNKNNTKKQYYNSLKFIKNPNNINNYTMNTNININSIQNSKNYDALNNFDEIDNENYYNNFFDDKSNDTSNELKKLLEKNLDICSNNFKSEIDPQKIFSQGIMESFCYFKIVDKDCPKFNPLDSCAVNPEALGYCEGYISIDVILGHLKIIPKRTAYDNFKSNNTFINKGMYRGNSSSENAFYNNLYNLNNNGKNNYLINNNFDNEENNLCLRIELKEINGVKIKKHMQDIMKIHKIFLKYNSHSGMEYEDNNGRIKRRVLSINKLIYMKEITAINMDQNEKIKAALCNFFSFTLVFGKNKNKVECIFINFDQFNIWNKCLETIAENNNKSTNALTSYRGLFHRKYNSNCHNRNKDNGNNTRDNYAYNN